MVKRCRLRMLQSILDRQRLQTWTKDRWSELRADPVSRTIAWLIRRPWLGLLASLKDGFLTFYLETGDVVLRDTDRRSQATNVSKTLS